MVFFNKDEQLENLGNGILDATWAAFGTLARNQIALTWVVYDPPVLVNTGGALTPNAFWDHPVRGFTYRGVERIYPASVVKLFYLVAVNEWLEKGMIQQASKELERALRDMIVDSSNDATSLVVDILSGTTSGAELPIGPFETWKYQRNIVNRYYQSLGWEEMETINACQKTWGDGPYGRERAFVGELLENRNMLTTNAIAKLLHSIVGGVAVSSGRSQAMMALLKRNLNDLPADTEENQVTGFLGGGLPENAQIWSKAGWTSQVRHDAAYIEIPEQRPYLLVVFTEGKAQAKSQAILPFVSKLVAEAIASL
ncbi:MAG: serine hydrolase [Nostoc sp. NOS(2021)]|uniref:serine hydrolase n=1 Tax=Nostoc sp. NOS(2021) TaxID=2815407 RepID=UPI0025FF0CF4|nr:serine hydrolase [Nostoc sp. NOS(2021)]MBN3899509.1 serine hydrolase [Nostoc sp. NOS(2021)]